MNNNNTFFKNRKYFKLFLGALTKIVINKRANLKLEKLIPLVRQANLINRNDKTTVSKNVLNDENNLDQNGLR